jgi:hypothetical protein
MPVSRLASESVIQDTDILTTGTATLTPTGTGTGTTDRTTMVGRHFIGITDTECTTRVGIVTTATGDKINGEKFSSWRVQYPASLFFWRG